MAVFCAYTHMELMSTTRKDTYRNSDATPYQQKAIYGRGAHMGESMSNLRVEDNKSIFI